MDHLNEVISKVIFGLCLSLCLPLLAAGATRAGIQSAADTVLPAGGGRPTRGPTPGLEPIGPLSPG